MTDSKAVVACVATVTNCGQNRDIADKIKQEITQTDGVFLLDISECTLSSRTIFTFAGPPLHLSVSVLKLAKTVKENVDFSKYNGDFPCFGALDDCAFIPIRRIKLEQCQDLASDFAQKLHRELDVSVYYYKTQDADSQSEILRFKASAKKNSSCKCPPLYVSSQHVGTSPSWGYTLIWASKGYINYHILLFSTKEQAHKISLDVRDIGRGSNQPGTLKGCQAIGVWDSASKIAQVAATLQDQVLSSSLHSAYEEVLKIATHMKLPLMGSQVIGMVPLRTLLDAADFYIKRDGLFVLEDELKVKLAITKLGLNAKEPFDPQKKILEFSIPRDDENSLVKKSVKDFIRIVGARVPVPAGGSVAATVAALGAGLGCMVAQMTYGRKQWEKFDPQMRRLIPIMHGVMEKVIHYVDEDTDAFNQYIAALKLPKDGSEEQTIRESALQEALVRTIMVPLDLARSVSLAWSAVEELAPIITEGAISDLRVGAWCLELAVKAAHSSILENVKSLKNDKYQKEVLDEIENHLQAAKEGKRAVLHSLVQRHP